jgi:hypothetical protein
MGQMFTILAFFTVLGIVVPVVGNVVPFGQTTSSNVGNPSGAGGCSFYSPNCYLSAAGGTPGGAVTTVVYSGTTYTFTEYTTATENASVAAGGTGIFGSIVSGTLLIFGNFFAALQYLANLVIGTILPGSYVYRWLNWSSDPGVQYVALAFGTMTDAIVGIAYANEWFYLISGRWIFPP